MLVNAHNTKLFLKLFRFSDLRLNFFTFKFCGLFFYVLLTFVHVYIMNIRHFLDFLERFDEQEMNKKETKSEPEVNQKSIFYEETSPKKSILKK